MMDNLQARLDAYEMGDQDQGSAVNAILAARHYLRDLVPITAHQTYQFPGSEKIWNERPGQLRGATGWLSAPNYVGNLNDACDLVQMALSIDWIAEIQVRADGSTARLHQFNPPCKKTDWHRGKPGSHGAATAIVRAVLDATSL